MKVTVKRNVGYNLFLSYYGNADFNMMMERNRVDSFQATYYDGNMITTFARAGFYLYFGNQVCKLVTIFLKKIIY